MARRRRLWPVVLAVQLGVLLAALDATIVGTAMPTVIAALGGAHLYPWVFSIYMLASTVVMPVFGGLSDRLGRRGPFVAAIVIFCAGSLMAGIATTMPALVVGRGVQGVGAGGVEASRRAMAPTAPLAGVIPPSTIHTAPVTKLAASEARNA